jgi:anti-sigma-K factor RskA
MSTPHTPPLEELLPAYALGALDGQDLRVLEEHLAGGCDECRRQLALWQGDLETLAAEIPPVQPAETTRARVLRLVGGAPATAPAARPRRTSPPWWMAAAAVFLLALAVWGLVRQSHLRKEFGSEAQSLAQERDRLRGQVEVLSREVERMQAEVREAQSVVEDRDRLRRQVEVLNREMSRAQAEVLLVKQDLQVLAAPGVKSVALAGLGPSPGAQGRTYVNPGTRSALFYAFDLPTLPDEKTYELWFIAAGKPVSAGTFAVDIHGRASLRVDRMSDIQRIEAWAVTIEPRGGVPKPTGAFVLKGT